MNHLITLQQHKNGDYFLSGELDRDTVPAFWRSKSDWTPKEQDIVIDLSGLKRVDSAGMAMLLHLQQDLAKLQQKVTFINMPEQLKTLMQLSNVINLLNN